VDFITEELAKKFVDLLTFARLGLLHLVYLCFKSLDVLVTIGAAVVQGILHGVCTCNNSMRYIES
jgi:hypothetical protein